MRSHHRIGEGVHRICRAWWAACTRARRASRKPSGRPSTTSTSRESMEDRIPRNRAGQIVSLADKLDTLRGCFRRGHDPHRFARSVRAAARGAGRGEDSGGRQDRVAAARSVLEENQALRRFFADRVKYLFQGHPRLPVRRNQRRHGGRLEQPGGSGSAPGAHAEPAADARFRAAGRQFQAHPNILEQAKFTGRRRRSTRACSKPARSGNCTRNTARIAGQPIENVISRLRPKVDLFFDKVLVNAPDARVRRNRLTLLHTLLAEFSTIADFSEIVTHS